MGSTRRKPLSDQRRARRLLFGWERGARPRSRQSRAAAAAAGGSRDSPRLRRPAERRGSPGTCGQASPGGMLGKPRNAPCASLASPRMEVRPMDIFVVVLREHGTSAPTSASTSAPRRVAQPPHERAAVSFHDALTYPFPNSARPCGSALAVPCCSSSVLTTTILPQVASWCNDEVACAACGTFSSLVLGAAVGAPVGSAAALPISCATLHQA